MAVISELVWLTAGLPYYDVGVVKFVVMHKFTNTVTYAVFVNGGRCTLSSNDASLVPSPTNPKLYPY